MSEDAKSREQLLQYVKALRDRLSGLERAEAEIGALARHQASVTRLGLRALADPEPPALMREAAALVAEALQVTFCAVLERLPDGRHLLLRAAYGFKEGWVGKTIPCEAPDARPGRGHLLADQVIFENLRANGRGKPPALLAEHRVASGMSMTIPGHDRPFGTLGAYTSERRKFTTHDINFLQAVAGILAAAIERRGAEDALRETEGRFKAFMDNNPSVAFMKDGEGRWVYLNKVYSRVFKKNPEDLIGRTDFDQFPEDIARQLRANDQAVLAGNQPVELMETVPTPDGVLRHWLVFKFPVEDRSGRRFLGGVAIDLTERMRAQEELRDQTRILRSILDSMGDGVVVADEKGEFLLFNPAARRIAGVGLIDSRPEEWTEKYGLYLTDGVTPHPVADLPLARAMRGESVDGHELLLRRTDLPAPVRLSLTARPVKDENGTLRGGVVVFRDVTEGRKGEQALKEEKALVELLQAVAVAANEAVHPEDAMQVALDGICAHTGWPVGHVYLVSESTPDELVPAPIWHLDDERRFETFRKVTMATRLSRGRGLPGRVLESGTPIWIIDVTKDTNFPRAKSATDIGVRAGFGFPILVGKEVAGVLEFFATEVREPDDRLLHAMSQIGTQLGRVIERKRARAALADEKERLAVTLRSIGDAVITTDVGGRVLLVNRAAEALTGWGQSEAAGRPLAEVLRLLDPRTRKPAQDPAREALDVTAGDAGPRTALLAGRDGSEKLIASDEAPIQHPDGEALGTVLVFRDITRQRRTEEEMLKTSKLESVGVLAGGIAHDFNNVLTAVLGNILLARMDLPAQAPAARRLTDAEQACLRAKDLTQQLLTFARGGEPIRKTTPIDDMVRESASLALRGTSVRCEFSLPGDLWPVDVDPGQMAQVINHLVLNAQQAMPDGGVVRIRAANVPPGPPDRRHAHPIQSGPRVRITVEDHGVGIPEENLARVFDPYFTTKEKGSGLGLAIAYSVVTKHGGRIAVESRVGIGTTFLIDLPASSRPPAEAGAAAPERAASQAPAPSASAAHPERARILVMDDEAPVMEVLGAILGHFGYEPDFARDGTEALAMYRAARDSGRPFDAVILDLTIPGGMGGKDTIRKLLEIDPQVRAIVASGYSDDPVMADYGRYGFRGVVPKPFRFEELREVLDHVLGPGKG